MRLQYSLSESDREAGYADWKRKIIFLFITNAIFCGFFIAEILYPPFQTSINHYLASGNHINIIDPSIIINHPIISLSVIVIFLIYGASWNLNQIKMWRDAQPLGNYLLEIENGTIKLTYNKLMTDYPFAAIYRIISTARCLVLVIPSSSFTFTRIVIPNSAFTDAYSSQNFITDIQKINPRVKIKKA